MTTEPDGRSALAVALSWVSTLTTVALEMALPCLAGVWLDRRLGTRIVFTVLGAMGGLALGVYHLIKIAAAQNKRRKN
ncbi:MAG: AtpZ/AtpI family protein [Pirellulales bacterium]|nr:AtpZ/AtpI family protein [Planctomycetales bacterium]